MLIFFFLYSFFFSPFSLSLSRSLYLSFFLSYSMKSIFRHRHFSRLYAASAAMVKLRFFYLMYLCVTATCFICSRVCVRCRSTDLGNQIIKVSIISKAQGNTVCMDVLSVRVSSSVLLARRYVRRINAANDPSPLSFFPLLLSFVGFLFSTSKTFRRSIFLFL